MKSVYRFQGCSPKNIAIDEVMPQSDPKRLPSRRQQSVLNVVHGTNEQNGRREQNEQNERHGTIGSRKMREKHEKRERHERRRQTAYRVQYSE